MHYDRVTVVDHPMVQHKLSKLRNKNTSSKDFRALVRELDMFEGYEATRDLALEPHEYYAKLPDSISQRDVLVVDPMLATGGSATAAIHYLRKQGVENIKLVVLVAAPAGIEAVLASDPDVQIYTCAIDECLNEHAYIVPGLGDAGDRIFGTK